MIDSNYISNVIASQQSYFAHIQSYNQNLGPQVYGQHPSDRPSYSGSTPGSIMPAPQMPPAVYQSGLYVPPNMVRPQYTTAGGLMAGALGIPPGPQFAPSEARMAAYQQMNRAAGDIAASVIATAPAAAGFAGWIPGSIVGAALGAPLGPIGSFAGGIMGGMITSSLVEAGVGSMVNPSVERYRMARQMQMEFATDPRLSRLSPTMGQLEQFAGRARETVAYGRMGGSKSSMEDFFRLASRNIEAGQLDTSQNMQDAEQKLTKLFENAGKIARLAKITLDQGNELMISLKNMGFMDIGGQVEEARRMIATANMAGLGVGQVQEIAMAGFQLGGRGGAAMAMEHAAGIGGIMRRGGQGAELIARMGGTQQAAIMSTQASMQLMQGPMGTAMMANMLGGRGIGNTNLAGVGQNLSPGQIAQMMTPGGRRKLMEQLGPQAGMQSLMGTIQEMQRTGTEINLSTVALMTGLSEDEVQLMATQAAIPMEDRLRAAVGTMTVARRGPSDYRGSGGVAGRLFHTGIQFYQYGIHDPGIQRDLAKGAGAIIGGALLPGLGAPIGAAVGGALGGLNVTRIAGDVSRATGKFTGSYYEIRKDVGMQDKLEGAFRVRARELALAAEGPDVLYRRAGEMEERLGLSSTVTDMLKGRSASSGVFRDKLMKYLNDPDSRSGGTTLEHMRHALQASGAKSDEIDKILGDLQTEEGRSSWGNYATSIAGAEMLGGEESRWTFVGALEDAGLTNGMTSDMMNELRKTGSERAWRNLIGTAKGNIAKMTPKERKALGEGSNIVSMFTRGIGGDIDKFASQLHTGVRPAEGADIGGEMEIIARDITVINPTNIIIQGDGAHILAALGFEGKNIELAPSGRY